MTAIDAMLADTRHRPYALPTGQWIYYQEWNQALFLHWPIPVEILRPHIPEPFHLDTFEGNCYVSLVAFTMERLRPRYLPAVPAVSDFEEINLRTYIDNDNKKGVYFLNIEAGKSVSAFLAKAISGLPYEKANMHRTLSSYRSSNPAKGFSLDTEFEVKASIENKSPLDCWLTERYCLYLADKNQYFRYDIHHQEWKLKTVDIQKLQLQYHIGTLDLSVQAPALTHYADGVQVVAWRRQELG